MAVRKTWGEKLADSGDLPKVVTHEGRVWLEAEGRRVVAKGQKWVVQDYRTRLATTNV
jgi:hypothetical protein